MADNDILIRIGANADELKKELNSASAQLSKFGSSVKDQSGKIAVGIGAAAAATAYLVKQSLDAIDANSKMAKAMGTSVASFETLARAGDLSGLSIEQITKASRELTIKLSEANSGSKASADAFARIGLSAKALSEIPVDKQIEAITAALENNIPAAEKAAAAADIFGKKNALAMLAIDSETLKTAAEEAVLFGHALSDIDAAKVEQANDAVSVFGYAMEGVTKQIGVELAPIMKALADQFKQTAKEGGGIGTNVRDGVDTAITAIGFLFDMADGVKRAFEVVANSILGTFSYIKAIILDIVHSISADIDRIPGVNITGTVKALEASKDQAIRVFEESKLALDEILNRPMPSEGLKKFVADARVAAEEAAKEAVKIKQSTESAAGITATGKVAKTAETKADPDIEARAKQLDAIRESLLSETEALRKKLEDDKVLLDQAVMDKTVSLQEAQEIERTLVEQHQAALTEIEKKNADDRAKIAEQESQARKTALSDMMGNLVSLMGSENKKMFEIGKKASIAQTAASSIEGAQKAFSALAGIPYVGPALGAAAAAAALLAGAARVRAIKSQSFGGAGHIGTISGGGGSSGGGGGGSEGGGGKTTNMFVRGINPNEMFSGSQLVDIINKAQSEGAQLRLA